MWQYRFTQLGNFSEKLRILVSSWQMIYFTRNIPVYDEQSFISTENDVIYCQYQAILIFSKKNYIFGP